MLAIERRHYILNHLQEKKRVLVSDLAQEFAVSEETIRRDLDKLEQDGYVVKTYGGAFIKEEGNVDLPYFVRKKKNVIAKQLIADIAVGLVEEGESVFLDGSSTALFIAKKLKSKKRLTVITNSVEVLVELADVTGWTVMSTGGMLKEGSFALVGSRAERVAEVYHVDKMFFSCKGLDLSGGVTDANDLDASMKRAMASSAKKLYLAVDGSKFSRVSFAKIMSIEKVDCVLTEQKPDDSYAAYFQEKGVTCIYPEV
ncbi:MAG: DeoR/GlpR transcriptional regulator [Clostridia bacterium]|nr:DeoR/GlpR transcriptional regulator [Clostridia bacterium]MBQ1942695.1 DeoR/GlpR transcriptional regulator [Clostridia bacterium]